MQATHPSLRLGLRHGLVVAHARADVVREDFGESATASAAFGSLERVLERPD